MSSTRRSPGDRLYPARHQCEGSGMSGDRSHRVDDMLLFARVVESGSLSAAARAAGSTRSAVSKAIARLEKHFGSRLLQRTTRRISLTAAGEALHVHCARIAAELQLAERTAGQMRGKPHGRL